jgi:hypothetical protein
MIQHNIALFLSMIDGISQLHGHSASIENNII